MLTKYKNEHDVDFHLAENVVDSAVHKSTVAGADVVVASTSSTGEQRGAHVYR